MDGSASSLQKQVAEYEILKSIYNDDVERHSDCEWLDVSIALEPLHDSRNSEVHAKVVMRVECDESYPQRAPKLSFPKSKGLSKVQIETLQQLLETEASKIVGEVMIFQLTEFVREFLHLHNKPGFKSFYDEMIQRNTLMERLKKQSEEVQKSIEYAVLKEKMNEKLNKVFSDEDNSSSGSEDESHKRSGRRRVRFMSITEGGVKNLSESENPCDHKCCKYLHFSTKVLRGKCIEHFEHSVMYHGIDVSTGEWNLIREYILKPQDKQNSKELLSDILKQVASIDTELQYLKRLKHENLVSYMDFKHVIERDHLVVYVVQEFVSNITLASYGLWDLEIDFPFIRNIANSLLKALAFLHQQNVLHRNIRLSSVYLSTTGTVKLGDYSILKRMDDLQLSCLQVQTGGGRCRTGRGADILQLAALLLGLAGVPADPANPPTLPAFVPQCLKDFLEKCFLDDEKRWSARQLLEHEFVKSDLIAEPCGSYRRRPSASYSRRHDPGGEDGEEDGADDLIISHIPSDLRSHSRLSSEFVVLEYLGSGSFGKVLKAKNRLDRGIYAIKAIELNPRNEALNRKMIREVKLLSKLNHENVVRYFNSWIETTNVDDSSSVTQVTSTPIQSLTGIQSTRDITSHRTDMAAEHEDCDDDEDDDSSSDDDDEENRSDESPVRMPRTEPSESIVFMDSERNAGGDTVDSAIEEDSEQNSETVKTLRNLYIQMEFCEKSTLRIAIDSGGLFNNSQRYWRLAREIVEGLAYIHQQDMIHRDLKPVNIFLDSYDHVKIGDFGLATTSVLKNNFIMMTTNIVVADLEGSSQMQTEDSHTTGVGTSFYVAPELQKQTGKAHYNKKVDIYSLGIILFEMAHAPFDTYMERCKTLSNLRLPEILAPSEMEDRHPPMMVLVRKLLSHDPNKRPSCSELLASDADALPPPQVEDSELQDFIRHTLSNPQSKAYKYLISSCLNQSPRVEDKLTYHSDIMISERSLAVQESVRDAVTEVMRRHGARSLNTPLLFPHTEQYTAADACVRLITHSGGVVMAPRDLRVPFARFVARTGVSHMRRYCLDRTYRERRAHGYHPREALECAFDIVSPTPGELTSDAEMISVLQEIINELPALKSRSYVIRINHTLLLEAILLCWGLEKLYTPIFQVLSEAMEGKHSKIRLTTNLESVAVSSQHSVYLVELFHKEEPLNKITSEIVMLMKRKEEAFTAAKKAVEQLKIIIGHAEAMGNKIPIKVCPGVVNTSPRCSGVMFNLSVLGAGKKRHKESCEVLAAGCRYDGLIDDFSKVFREMGSVPRDVKQSGVGMSVSLEKLVKIVKENMADDLTASPMRVVVCSSGQDSLMRTKAELVRGLRAIGLTSYILENVQAVDDVETFCRENQISHIVWLKESERGMARVHSWDSERERYVEKKTPVSEVVEVVARLTRQSSDDLNTRHTLHAPDAGGSQTVNINIIAEDKMQASNRRRYETQVKSKMTAFLTNFSSRPTIEILGLLLDSKIIKAIAANLDFADDANDFAANTKTILEMFPRHKKYLIRVCDKIHSYFSGKENLIIILYSLNDDKFKQVM